MPFFMPENCLSGIAGRCAALSRPSPCGQAIMSNRLSWLMRAKVFCAFLVPQALQGCDGHEDRHPLLADILSQDLHGFSRTWRWLSALFICAPTTERWSEIWATADFRSSGKSWRCRRGLR